MMDLLTSVNMFKLGTIVVILIVAVYILGYVAKLAWHWIDRGERKLPHPYTHFFCGHSPTGQCRLEDDEGHVWSAIYSSREIAELALKSMIGTRSYWTAGRVVSSDIIPTYELRVTLYLSIATAAASCALALVVTFPVVCGWAFLAICSAFGARVLVDLQKGASKLSKAIKTHIDDTKAHTADAVKVDTDLVGVYEAREDQLSRSEVVRETLGRG